MEWMEGQQVRGKKIDGMYALWGRGGVGGVGGWVAH